MARYTETINIPYAQISPKEFLDISLKITTSANTFFSKFKIKGVFADSIKLKVFRMSVLQGLIEIQCNSFNDTADINFISFGNPQSWTNRVGRRHIQSFLQYVKSTINDYLKLNEGAERSENLKNIINKYSEEFKYSQTEYNRKIIFLITFIPLMLLAIAGYKSCNDSNIKTTESQTTEYPTINGTYTYSDNSIEATINIDRGTWSGKILIKSGMGIDYDNRNARFERGVIKGNDLYESSGMVRVGSISGRSISTSIGGQQLTLSK